MSTIKSRDVFTCWPPTANLRYKCFLYKCSFVVLLAAVGRSTAVERSAQAGSIHTSFSAAVSAIPDFLSCLIARDTVMACYDLLLRTSTDFQAYGYERADAPSGTTQLEVRARTRTAQRSLLTALMFATQFAAAESQHVLDRNCLAKGVRGISWLSRNVLSYHTIMFSLITLLALSELA